MKISGFSFIRDGVRFGYPFEESIRSILPLVDEFVIAVGDSDDGTLQRIQAITDPKLRIIQTRWNENMRSNGFVFGQQKMIAQYGCTGDWVLYLEGDELFDAGDLEPLRKVMRDTLDDPQIEALSFDYLHFWGEPGLLRNTPGMYRKATRAIKNHLRCYAPDGLYWAVIREQNLLGRRNKRRTRYPRALDTGIQIYHYGNVRHQRYLAPRATSINRYWKGNHWFDSYGEIDPATVQPFTGQHPPLIQSWLQHHGNHELQINPAFQPSFRQRKHRWLQRIEALTGLDFSKRHFKLLKKTHSPVSARPLNLEDASPKIAALPGLGETD